MSECSGPPVPFGHFSGRQLHAFVIAFQISSSGCTQISEEGTLPGKQGRALRFPQLKRANVYPPMSRIYNEWNTMFRTRLRWKAWCFRYYLPGQSGSSLRTWAKGMSMPSSGLSLSQWDLYAIQINMPHPFPLVWRPDNLCHFSLCFSGSELWQVRH